MHSVTHEKFFTGTLCFMLYSLHVCDTAHASRVSDIPIKSDLHRNTWKRTLVNSSESTTSTCFSLDGTKPCRA